MKKQNLIKALVIVLACLIHYKIIAQENTVIRNESHFVANLDFTPSAGVYKQRKNRIVNASHNQGFPNEYTEKNITVKGMVEAAVLTVDWWTLFGEPVENYSFQWTSTRKYHISEYGGRLNMTVTRDMVSKYSDLLMRFDAIKPLDIKFKIYWKHSDEAYKKNLHYTFSSNNRNQSVSTNVNTGLLFEPSGKEPLSVPGIRQGKGLQFIDQTYDSYQHYDLNEEQKKSWIVEYNKTSKIIIDQFFVSDIKWPVGEMKAIADKYEQYERGEATPSPTQIINEELRKNQHLTAYNNNDFWGDAYEDEFKPFEIKNDISGKRQNVVSDNKIIYSVDPSQYQLNYFSTNKRFITKWDTRNKTYQIINSKGVVQSIDGYTVFENIQGNAIYIYQRDYKRIRILAKLSGIMGPDGSLDFDSMNKAIDALNRWDDGYTRKEKENIKAGREIYRLSTYLSSRNSPYGVGSFKKYILNENLKIVNSNIVFQYFAENDYK